MNTGYLPLTDYSTKYKISVSTLRRKIKAEDVDFVFEDGKYFILDGPLSTHQRSHRPSPEASEWKSSSALMSAPQLTSQAGGISNIISEEAPMFAFANNTTEFNETPLPKANAKMSVPISEATLNVEDSVLAAANRLLTELKKAYSQILHDKEEQVLHLKEELADLKTLVRVLESENDRLSRRLK